MCLLEFLFLLWNFFEIIIFLIILALQPWNNIVCSFLLCSFAPENAFNLLEKDPTAFEYWYQQVDILYYR